MAIVSWFAIDTHGFIFEKLGAVIVGTLWARIKIWSICVCLTIVSLWTLELVGRVIEWTIVTWATIFTFRLLLLVLISSS